MYMNSWETHSTGQCCSHQFSIYPWSTGRPRTAHPALSPSPPGCCGPGSSQCPSALESQKSCCLQMLYFDYMLQSATTLTMKWSDRCWSCPKCTSGKTLSAEKVIRAFISSRLDYCNAWYSGLSQKSLSHLRLVQLFDSWQAQEEGSTFHLF